MSCFHCISQHLRRAIVSAWDAMAINRQRDAGRGVAQPPRDVRNGDTTSQQKGDGRVSPITENPSLWTFVSCLGQSSTSCVSQQLVYQSRRMVSSSQVAGNLLEIAIDHSQRAPTGAAG